MKKLAVLLCALAVGCSVLPIAACNGEEQEPHEHTYATVWSKDKTHHWHDALCGDTDEVADKAQHSYDENHECTVCRYRNTDLGTVTIGDITAWTDIGGEFTVNFSDPSKAEGLKYSYATDKIKIDPETKTVTVLNNTTGIVRVTVSSENHATTAFNVTCKNPVTSKPKYEGYADMLGEGIVADSGTNPTGQTVTVSENTTVFIGDSFFDVRWFWTDFYTDDYKNKDVFLAGISEATTTDWEKYMESVFAVFGDKTPKNIVIHLGTNDLGAGSNAAETAEGVRRTVTLLHNKFPQTKIYYFGITHRYDNNGPSNVTIDSVNVATKNWCETKDYATYINTPELITADLIQADGIHPLLNTYSVFTDALGKAGCVIENK